MEKERCDNEKEVFNARVNEDEMIITIDEYTTLRAAAENYEKARQEMKAHIAYLEKKLNEETEEKSNIQEALKIKQLEETIELKEKEIKDIKFSVSDVLLQIRNINESNNYSDPSVKKRKISELCTDTRYELLIDELEVCYKKQKTKIIELPNTDQSNK